MVRPAYIECLLRVWIADFRLSPASGSIAPIPDLPALAKDREDRSEAVIRIGIRTPRLIKHHRHSATTKLGTSALIGRYGDQSRGLSPVAVGALRHVRPA